MNKQTLRNAIVYGLFIIPFLSFLVSSSLFFPYITTKAFAWRVIVEIIFGAWLILSLTVSEYRPKKSLLMYAVFVFLAVIGVADIFGVAPLKSFWSNFERMDGFVSLLHLGAYFVVAGSIFTEELWKKWWRTELVASALMAGYALLQLAGVAQIAQGGARVDGTFGNATYLAVYMLFNIFMAAFFMVREWRMKGARYVYGALILLQTVVLYYTATRGAILGLIGGIVVFAILSLWNKAEPGLRKVSIGVLAGILVLIGGFLLARHTSFVRESPVLSRFATLNLSDLRSQGRYYVWPMAWEGFKENPLLGWGQENFTYVFQKNYKAEMYSLEPWFDRAHNIFLDWMVAGGILGLLAYLSLYAVALYLLWKKSDLSFTERSMLTALFVAYFFHNFFVFDHLASYVLFFSLLSYIHFRTGKEVLWNTTLKTTEGRNGLLGAVAVGTLIVLYFVNWQPIMANTSLLSALKNTQGTQNYQVAITDFEDAYGAARLGRSEVMEQGITNAVAILQSDISMDEKNRFFNDVKDMVKKEGTEFGNDARYNMAAGSFLLTTGSVDEALQYLREAERLSPQKQAIKFQISEAYIYKKDFAQALLAAKNAYLLGPSYGDAAFTYAVVAIYAGDRAVETQLKNAIFTGDADIERDLKKKGKEADIERWTESDLIVRAYLEVSRYDDALTLVKRRLERDPENPQSYITLATIFLRSGDRNSAISTLGTLGSHFPSYKGDADEYIRRLKAGESL